MPILNKELINRALKKINKKFQNIKIKKDETYIIGSINVRVLGFSGNNVIYYFPGSTDPRHASERSKEIFIKAIKDNSTQALKQRDGVGDIIKKRADEVVDPVEEGIKNSPTINEVPKSSEGYITWNMPPSIR